jgi:aminoglycoside 3-N-acetyltransferase
MALTIEISILRKHLDSFFQQHPEEAFLLHTDVGAWGLLKDIKKREDLLNKYSEILYLTSFGRTLLFPVFNYDYGQSRKYDVLNDKCQVGVLNEFVRLQNPKQRTKTPIFNFIEVPGRTFHFSPDENPFGQKSIWNSFCERDGRVCFMGAGFHSNTFIHHIEEIMDIGYRYLKPMPGVVACESVLEHVDFFFRVRPRQNGVVDYDWERLETDLLKNGLLDQQSLGIGEILSFNAKDVLAFWLDQLEKDEFYFLTETSKAKISELRSSKAYPFRFEDFELELAGQS